MGRKGILVSNCDINKNINGKEKCHDTLTYKKQVPKKGGGAGQKIVTKFLKSRLLNSVLNVIQISKKKKKKPKKNHLLYI